MAKTAGGTATVNTTAAEDEQLVASRDVGVLFMSRRQNLRLVKTPVYPKYGPGGRVVGQEAGETIVFHDGVFRCPESGDVKLDVGRVGDAEEVLEWLREHALFGDPQDGFWEVPPTAPPVSQEELQTLLEIATEQDEERLALFVEQERGGWARAGLLEPAEAALAKLKARGE